MLTIVVILAIWLLLSVPMSVVLGLCMRDENGIELEGMDGDVVVFRRSDGSFVRVPLGARASH